jgi:hypothetical protein
LRGQHAAFHGLTPMATPYRRSAAESQNAWLAGPPTRAQPSLCSCSCSCSECQHPPSNSDLQPQFPAEKLLGCD